MNSDWYQKSINALTLAGKGERTVEAYTRALRMLVAFHGKEPAEVSEADLEAYFLHRRNVDHWSPNTMRICYCGIRFFFVSVLGRDWRLFQYLRAREPNRGCPRSCRAKRCARFWVACTPPTTTPSSRRCTPVDCACKRRFSWKCATSMRTG